MKKTFFLFTILCLSISSLFGQTKEKGYIISMDGDRIYIDLPSSSVKKGDFLSVYTPAGYIIHPVSKKRIEKEPELIARIQVEESMESYSTAKAIPFQAAEKLRIGMEVQKEEQPQMQKRSALQLPNDGKSAVVIAPAQVNDIIGIGYFGNYVADMLMEQMMYCNNVRILDRTVLMSQMDELNLAKTGHTTASTSIQQGKMLGAQYIIQVTMQKPDVVNVGTRIPLAAFTGAIQGISNTNIGAQYIPDVGLSKLKSSVSLTARVVDLQTGEVLFMTSGIGKSQGATQLSMEQGALNGAQINGGVEGFKQTVTGKAIQRAFEKIGIELTRYFNGETTERITGSISGYNHGGQELIKKGKKLYLGTEKLDKEARFSLFEPQPNLLFKYRIGKRIMNTAYFLFSVGTLGTFGLVSCEIVTPGIALGCGTLAASGILWFIGNQEISKVVKVYNASQKKAYSSTLSFGITSEGRLGMTLRF